MTDCELVAEVLKCGKWTHILAIVNQCKPGAVNWAVRSRISDLKKKGYGIESRISKDGQAEYRMTRQPGETAVEFKFDATGQGSFI